MNYQDALAELDRHINHEARAGKIEGLSVEPMRALMGAMGDPHRACPVIHVTGTNGKGTTARMVSALLAEHGLTVGTFTSPHLERVNERIARNGEPISDDAFAELVAEVVDVSLVAGVVLSYFELLTAAALAHFANEAVDVAVLEVGLLGRYDATNVADAQVAVVTNVGLDHVDPEGDWRAGVAWEKAGIVKPESFLVLGETDPELRPVFDAESHGRCWVRDEHFGATAVGDALGGQIVDLFTPDGAVDDVFVPLFGRHQADNAAVALAAVEAFFGRPCDPGVVRAAFGSVRAPGRFEVVRRQPLVILDGAHNVPGAHAAAETLHESFQVDGRRILVLGLLSGPGRALDVLLDAFDVAHTDLVITTTPDSPRAVPASVVADAVRRLGVQTEAIERPADAVGAAVGAADDDDVVLICGSLYLVGEARALLLA